MNDEPRDRPFLDMESAPRDGSIIEVKYGPWDEVVLAHWAALENAFVRDNEALRRVLFDATGWRPARTR